MNPLLLRRSILLTLVTGLVILPISLTVLWGVSCLLRAMGETRGGAVFGYIGLAGGILWAIDLVCLVAFQGLSTLAENNEANDSPASRDADES